MGLNDSPAIQGGNPFSSGMGSGDRLKDYVGQLLVIQPTDYIEDFSTTLGETEVVIADVAVIDEKNPAKSKELTGVVIFGKAMVPYLKRIMEKGKPALGRMIQRKSTGAGKSGAWALDQATPEEIAAGVAYLDSRRVNPFASAGSEPKGE